MSSGTDLEVDRYLFLEEVTGSDSLSWIDKENRRTQGHFRNSANFKENFSLCYQTLTDTEKIPLGQIAGSYYYNLKRDSQHQQGLLQRTPIEDFPKLNWQDVLDYDELSQVRGQKLTHGGISVLSSESDLALIRLQLGGKDTCLIEEFNLKSRSFVENGFKIPEGKKNALWLNENEVLYSAGRKSKAGYCMEHFTQKRGERARQVHSAAEKSIISFCFCSGTSEKPQYIIGEMLSFYQMRAFLFQPEINSVQELDLPLDIQIIGIIEEKIFIRSLKPIQYNGRSIVQDAVVEIDYRTKKSRILFENTHDTFLDEAFLLAEAPQKIILLLRQNTEVRVATVDIGLLDTATHQSNSTDAAQSEMDVSKKMLSYELLPGLENQVGQDWTIVTLDKESSTLFLKRSSFLHPNQLYTYDLKTHRKSLVKEGKSFFDSSRYEVTMDWSVSEDGTKIPYKVIRGKDSKGPAPAWVYAYGGFYLGLKAEYLSDMGKAWLDRGGIYVVAHIRGGNEFGAAWHNQVLKTNRIKCFQDFASVIQSLHTNGVTTPDQTLIEGRSNGGLLVGATAILYPQLMKKVMSGVPLLDMVRYPHLLAGSLWTDEYGSVDESEEIKKSILQYSPYQNIHASPHLPEFFVWTARTDDRVHPGHARKMAAKLNEFNHKYYFYELEFGGHKGDTAPFEMAEARAIRFCFAQELFNPEIDSGLSL